MAKSAEAFRTISEVSELLDTPAHVLRFWESRFSQVRPVKRAGGRRYYRPNDLALLGGIKKLLHIDGLTIRGVQKILKEQGIRHVAGLSMVDLSTSGEPDAASKAVKATERPAAPSPDVAESDDRLRPDPDDSGRNAVESTVEAPMQVDAPTLPLGQPDNVHAFTPPEPATTPEPKPQRPPAAAMLRAMDALRIRDKKSELHAVYLRLIDLRERLAQGDAPSRG
ncbi:MAG: MerR family transcriptional regulator [Albidovulum sp.]|uniref:MerR family transcriptional regulator n=1 Tax=Albidovulum sp. TaxID=1872424 RepID=UPI003C80A79F